MLAILQHWALLLVPIFFWAAYHYYKDRHRPEPVGILIFALGLGYLSAYLGLYLYQLLDLVGLRYDAFSLAAESKVKLFLYAVLAIGPIEELAKFVPFIFVLIRIPHFNEAIDGVIYASFIGLGFALHENQNYLSFLNGNEAFGRAIAAPMVHVLFASIWGYAYGYADTHNINRVLATVTGLLISMFLHGVYDFFAIGVSDWTNVAPPIIILVIWLTRMWLIRHARHPLD